MNATTKKFVKPVILALSVLLGTAPLATLLAKLITVPMFTQTFMGITLNAAIVASLLVFVVDMLIEKKM